MKKFAIALGGLATTLGEPMSVNRIEGYCAVLSEYEEDALVDACAVFMKTSKWMPRPVEFVDLIERGEVRGSNSEHDAMLAWSDLQKIWTDVSDISEMVASDGRIAAGVEALGGWFAMVHSGEDPKWQRRAFVSAYQGQHYREIRQRLGIRGVGNTSARVLGGGARNLRKLTD